MSSCPTKDIHSIYLDNELPAVYVKEYEDHISHCPKCAAELKKLRAVHIMLKTDAVSMTPDSHYVQQSYVRLISRMSYSKVTQHVYQFHAEWFKYIIPAAAAAVVLAVILPIRFAREETKTSQTAMAVPLTRRKPVSIAKQNLVINGNITHSSIGMALVSNNPSSTAETSTVSYGNASHFDPFTQNVSTDFDPSFTDVDMFFPDFDDQRTVSIKVSVPGINSLPVTTEVMLPINTLSGQLK
jgi:hypothetical protein